MPWVAKIPAIFGPEKAPDEVSCAFDPSTTSRVGSGVVVVKLVIVGTSVGVTVGAALGAGWYTTTDGARVDESTNILEGASEEEEEEDG